MSAGSRVPSMCRCSSALGMRWMRASMSAICQDDRRQMVVPSVLCIRHDPLDSLGVAPRLLRDAGCEVVVLDAIDDQASWPDAGSAVGGLVVFGGEMNVDQLERYPYLLRVRQLMREAVDGGIPTLGICLGAQLLARAFGAAVTRAPVRELGFVPIWPTMAAASDPLLRGLTPGDQFFQWHEDTFGLPAGATLLATGRAVPTQAYRVGGCGWGVQFHPEVDAAELAAWLRPVQSQWGRASEEILLEAAMHLPVQGQRARGLFLAFAGLVSARATPSAPA